MKGKPLIMIGIAVIFGGISIFVADIWLERNARSRVEIVQVPAAEPSKPAVEFKTIVVAKQPLRFGASLTPEMVVAIPWADQAVPDGAFTTVEQLMEAGERVALSPIEPNEPILNAKISGPGGRGTLANLLTPGMRAVTIRVDDVTGVAGFVTPGDRVDVMITREAFAEGQTGGRPQVEADVLMENVKVLSKDQNADERQTGAEIARSVTIEVDHEGARRIAVAQQEGTLSLILRPAGDTTMAPATTVDAGSMLPSLTDVTAAVKTKEPAVATVIVTRAHEPQTYTVVSEGRQPGAARMIGDQINLPAPNRTAPQAEQGADQAEPAAAGATAVLN